MNSSNIPSKSLQTTSPKLPRLQRDFVPETHQALFPSASEDSSQAQQDEFTSIKNSFEDLIGHLDNFHEEFSVCLKKVNKSTVSFFQQTERQKKHLSIDQLRELSIDQLNQLEKQQQQYLQLIQTVKEEMIARLLAIQEQQQRPKREKCMVCGVTERTSVLLPCRHQSVCQACSNRIVHCPLCNSNVTDAIHIQPT